MCFWNTLHNTHLCIHMVNALQFLIKQPQNFGWEVKIINSVRQFLHPSCNSSNFVHVNWVGNITCRWSQQISMIFEPNSIEGGGRQCMNKCNVEVHMWNHCCAILLSHLQPVWIYHIFPHYLIKAPILGKNYGTYNVCFDFLYFCLKHFSICKEFSKILSRVHRCLQVKHPLFLPDFKQTQIFSTGFQNILRHQISWKSIQWEPSYSTWTDRQMDGQTW